MQAAGLAAFAKRTEAKSRIYSYERVSVEFDQTAREEIQGEQEGVGLLPGPAALLPEDHDRLGQRREAGGDAPAPAGQVDGCVREWQALHGMKKYTFADYAFQFVTVTAGVLIALFIDGLAETEEQPRAGRERARDDHARNRRQQEGSGRPVRDRSQASKAEMENAISFANDILSTGKTTQSIRRQLQSAHAPTFDRLADAPIAPAPSPTWIRGGPEVFRALRLPGAVHAQQRKAIDLQSPPATADHVGQSFDPDHRQQEGHGEISGAA